MQKRWQLTFYFATAKSDRASNVSCPLGLESGPAGLPNMLRRQCYVSSAAVKLHFCRGPGSVLKFGQHHQSQSILKIGGKIIEEVSLLVQERSPGAELWWF